MGAATGPNAGPFMVMVPGQPGKVQSVAVAAPLVLSGTLTAPVVGLPAGCAAGKVLTGISAEEADWETPAGGGPPTGAAGGDLGGTYPHPSVLQVNGVTIEGSPSLGETLVALDAGHAHWAPPTGGTPVYPPIDGNHVHAWDGKELVGSTFADAINSNADPLTLSGAGWTLGTNLLWGRGPAVGPVLIAPPNVDTPYAGNGALTVPLVAPWTWEFAVRPLPGSSSTGQVANDDRGGLVSSPISVVGLLTGSGKSVEVLYSTSGVFGWQASFYGGVTAQTITADSAVAAAGSPFNRSGLLYFGVSFDGSSIAFWLNAVKVGGYAFSGGGSLSGFNGAYVGGQAGVFATNGAYWPGRTSNIVRNQAYFLSTYNYLCGL